MFRKLLVPMPPTVTTYLLERSHATGRHPRDLASQLLEDAVVVDRRQHEPTVTRTEPTSGTDQ